MRYPKAAMRIIPDIHKLRAMPPLDSIPEQEIQVQKRSSEGVGTICRTLTVLRVYLVAMTLMLGFHVLDLAGVLHKIP